MNDERCQHVVYIESCCHTHETPPAQGVALRPFTAVNGKGAIFGTGAGAVTQQLPQVRLNGSFVGKAEAPRKEEAEDTPRRHREDDGIDMKDMTLGALIGAAGAIFVVGLLLIFLIR